MSTRTSIAFFGNTPGNNASPTFSINIDSQVSSGTYPGFAVYTQVVHLPILVDGPHNITLYNLDLIDVDYAIITPGDQTPLEGTTLAVVDDSDPEIVYHGMWKKQIGQQFHPGDGTPDIRSLRDTTHASNNTGDSFVFQFAGTSVSVHGFLPLASAGSFSVTFTLDGTSSISTVSPDPVETSNLGNMLVQPNCLFYKSPTLAPGKHSLLVNVTDIIGEQNFIIDFLTYTPSFTRLSEKPNFGSSVAQPKSPTTTNVSEPVSSTTGQTGSRRQHIGAIIGGVVGGVIVLLVILFLFLFAVRRRKTKEVHALAAEPFVTMPADGAIVERGCDLKVPKYSSPSASTSHPIHQAESQQGSERMTSLMSQVEEAQTNGYGGNVDVEVLCTRIDHLTRENERLMRGYLPPPDYNTEASGPSRRMAPRHDSH
ncbi:hypothetical protein WG66_016731 [Moniliophthora roreri]|nr:hypothetical protein WG66_016731 [Moniliophthora roreri]